MAKLELNLLIDSPYRRKLSAQWLDRVVSETLEGRGLPVPAEVGVVITNDRVVADLNRRYRGISGSTDVLSFSLDGEAASGDSFVSPPDRPYHLGEVVVSYPQAARQASEYGRTVEEEVAILTVHGLLHLMGFDHEEEEEERAMRAQEAQALAVLGIGEKGLDPGKAS